MSQASLRHLGSPSVMSASRAKSESNEFSRKECISRCLMMFPSHLAIVVSIGSACLLADHFFGARPGYENSFMVRVLQFGWCFTLLPIFGSLICLAIAASVAGMQDRDWSGVLMSPGTNTLLLALLFGAAAGLLAAAYLFLWRLRRGRSFR